MEAPTVSRTDVEMGASVKAKRMRSRSRPKTDVDFDGEVCEPGKRADLQTTSGNERQNLPKVVEPVVTYRDVRLRWRAATRLGDPDDQ